MSGSSNSSSCTTPGAGLCNPSSDGAASPSRLRDATAPTFDDDDDDEELSDSVVLPVRMPEAANSSGSGKSYSSDPLST